MLTLTACSGMKLDNMSVSDAVNMGMTASQLSDEEFEKTTQDAVAQSDASNRVAPPGNRYAKRLARLTRKHRNEDGMTLNYKVYLADEFNAVAFPDGSVRVYKELMDKMNDQQLLAVIGHEVGHVKHGHSADAMRTAILLRLAREGAAASGGTGGAIAASELGGLVEAVVNSQFSQSQESEADAYAVAFMKRNGYSPGAAVEMLEILARHGGGGGMLDSHPAPGDRVDDVRQMVSN